MLWYLPIIPRFKRLFANGDDAKDLTWHVNGRNCDGMLCHPADSSQWKKIDCLYSYFVKEARNLRLGLATDGMNPSMKDLDMGDSDKCWLYVEENPPHLVATGRLYEGSTTVHNIPLHHDQVKVDAEEVTDADAHILVPTEEAKLVG